MRPPSLALLLATLVTAIHGAEYILLGGFDNACGLRFAGDTQPVYYTELTGEVTDEQSDLITKANTVKKASLVGGLVIFGTLFFLGGYLIVTGYFQRKADQPQSRCFRFRDYAPREEGDGIATRHSINGKGEVSSNYNPF